MPTRMFPQALWGHRPEVAHPPVHLPGGICKHQAVRTELREVHITLRIVQEQSFKLCWGKLCQVFLQRTSVCVCRCDCAWWWMNSQRRVPGDSMSSSMSSRSSERSMCCGGAVRIPRQAGSRLSAEAKNGRPGLFTMLKPVRDSICCQRFSFSLRAAVTSPKDCLWERDTET